MLDSPNCSLFEIDNSARHLLHPIACVGSLDAWLGSICLLPKVYVQNLKGDPVLRSIDIDQRYCLVGFYQMVSVLLGCCYESLPLPPSRRCKNTKQTGHMLSLSKVTDSSVPQILTYRHRHRCPIIHNYLTHSGSTAGNSHTKNLEGNTDYPEILASSQPRR